MAQINFRVNKEIKNIVDFISKTKGISAAEIAKRATLKEISDMREKIAFDLLKKGKIGRKKAWSLSGLSAMEFLKKWTENECEEKIPDSTVEKEINLIDTLDIKKYRK